MSVVIIGGNECMSRQYADVCMEHGCTAKVFPKETGPIEKKIGSPDLMILFTRTVSHKMVPLHGCRAAAFLHCGHCWGREVWHRHNAFPEAVGVRTAWG